MWRLLPKHPKAAEPHVPTRPVLKNGHALVRMPHFRNRGASQTQLIDQACGASAWPLGGSGSPRRPVQTFALSNESARPGNYVTIVNEQKGARFVLTLLRSILVPLDKSVCELAAKQPSSLINRFVQPSSGIAFDGDKTAITDPDSSKSVVWLWLGTAAQRRRRLRCSLGLPPLALARRQVLFQWPIAFIVPAHSPLGRRSAKSRRKLRNEGLLYL
jgi:hypothetical protein